MDEFDLTITILHLVILFNSENSGKERMTWSDFKSQTGQVYLGTYF